MLNFFFFGGERREGKHHADTEWVSHLHIKKKGGGYLSAAMHTHAYTVIASQHMVFSVLSDKATHNKKWNFLKNDIQLLQSQEIM